MRINSEVAITGTEEQNKTFWHSYPGTPYNTMDIHRDSLLRAGPFRVLVYFLGGRPYPIFQTYGTKFSSRPKPGGGGYFRSKPKPPKFLGKARRLK